MLIDDGHTATRVARLTGIPRSTVRDRSAGRNLRKKRPGDSRARCGWDHSSRSSKRKATGTSWVSISVTAVSPELERSGDSGSPSTLLTQRMRGGNRSNRRRQAGLHSAQARRTLYRSLRIPEALAVFHSATWARPEAPPADHAHRVAAADRHGWPTTTTPRTHTQRWNSNHRDRAEGHVCLPCRSLRIQEPIRRHSPALRRRM
jgi:hypothetical protein